MIQMAVDYCNCCYTPADQCVVVNDMIQRGADPAVIELITHEVLCPEDVNDIDTRLYTGRTERTG